MPLAPGRGETSGADRETLKDLRASLRASRGGGTAAAVVEDDRHLRAGLFGFSTLCEIDERMLLGADVPSREAIKTS